jgi:acetyltransferase-like isoleucine patch superfamily enzyme
MSIRKSILSLRGCRIGDNVIIGKIFIQIPEQIAIGNKCFLEDQVRLRVGGPWKQSSIAIGENTFIGHSTQINVGSKFVIGKNCMIAPGCIFSDAQHGFDDLDIPMKNQKCNYYPITVSDDVWIGSGVMVLSGVTIGKGVIIAAGSVVNKNVPDYEMWGGVPAKKIKSRIKE